MSSRYSSVTATIHELIIRYASNSFRFIILNPTQRTSNSAPRFLPEKQRREHASTPMHRLPQCHLENPRVQCQNIYQVNQYDTPLSPRVFIARHTSSVLKSIKVFNPIRTKSQRENSIHHNKIEREKRHMIQLYWQSLRYIKIVSSQEHEREREIKHIATGTNPQPRGWTTSSSSWWLPGWWRWPPVMIPPLAGCRNEV